MHVRIFESLKLEGSYVGDLLDLLYSIIAAIDNIQELYKGVNMHTFHWP